MLLLYLILFSTQSLALQYTLPDNFGGQTEFSERGWRQLVKDLATEVKFGTPPTAQRAIIQEPTCFDMVGYCSTTYFGKNLKMKSADTASLWVKWHQDTTPFACDSPNGCTIASAHSVADLTSQTEGWSVTASLSSKAATNNDKPVFNAEGTASLSFQYSNSQTTSTTITSTKTLTPVCSQNNMCYLQTGTLMMTVSGLCDSQPIIHCKHDINVCEAYSDIVDAPCSQWAHFALNNCKEGSDKPSEEQCSITVAVTGDDGQPVAFQVFEQKPIEGLGSPKKRESEPSRSPFGVLPDGSSGSWMAWSP